MKVLFRIVAVVLFIIFFSFALTNSEPVVLRFLGNEVNSPLALLLLAFFAGGAALGILSMIPTVFRYRREVAKQKKAIQAMQKESESQQTARAQPPSPDGIVNQ